MKEEQARRELVRESEWSREYRIGPNTYFFESKFQADGLQIFAAVLRRKWADMSDEDRIDFANAFASKPTLTAEDQEILAFLMEASTEPIWGTIAPHLAGYNDHEFALGFLLKHALFESPMLANYYMAFSFMRDERAIPLLQQHFNRYRIELEPFADKGYMQLFNYLHCCQVLAQLTNADKYRSALEELVVHPDESVRRRAKSLLSKTESKRSGIGE